MRTVALAALLSLASQAQAGVYAYNDASDINNKINITVTNEWVDGLLVKSLSQVVTIPTRVNQQYHTIRLCHDTISGTQPWVAATPRFEVAVHPSSVPSGCKIVSAWGTLLAVSNVDTALFRAIQTDRAVRFHGDYEADDALDPPGINTGGVLILRGNKGCWPAGLAAKALLRLEARGASGGGLAQFNVYAGNGLVEGTANEGNMGFRDQQKGYARQDQPDTSGRVELMIPPGANEGVLGVLSNFTGTVQCKGFELRP